MDLWFLLWVSMLQKFKNTIIFLTICTGIPKSTEDLFADCTVMVMEEDLLVNTMKNQSSTHHQCCLGCQMSIAHRESWRLKCRPASVGSIWDDWHGHVDQWWCYSHSGMDSAFKKYSSQKPDLPIITGPNLSIKWPIRYTMSILLGNSHWKWSTQCQWIGTNGDESCTGK